MTQGKKWIVPLGMKHCSQCGQTKPLEDFSIARNSPDGRFSYCRVCLKEKNSKRTPELRQKWHLHQKYGLTLERYKEMLSEQKGVCAICKRPQVKGRALSVDHCHRTGRVRSLLCVKCNTILGHLGDSLKLLSAIKLYLTSHTS